MRDSDLREQGKQIEAELRAKSASELNEMAARFAECEAKDFCGGDALMLLEKAPYYVLLVRSNENGGFGWKRTPTWRCRFVAPDWFEVEDEDISRAVVLAYLKLYSFPNATLPKRAPEPLDAHESEGEGA